jgi:4-hydroxybenzoate polyprenyltransferase
MRVDKPVGFWLLLWPTLWALWIASAGIVSIKLLVIFIAGVFIMRSAGCVVNDIADRKFDPYVARTVNRPLAAKEITLTKALILLGFLLLCALGLVLCLNLLCFELACVGLVITLIYPLMKRWIHAPQFVLGLAFSLGIPMAFAAAQGNLSHFSWTLWILGVLWPIIYDTLYAMTDREDDLKLGLHSTAIWFGKWDQRIIGILEFIWLGLWIVLGQQYHLNIIFYLGIAISASLLIYEHYKIHQKTPEECFKAFLRHARIGGIIFVGIVLGV